MDNNETITKARNFLKVRTDSLLSDVRYCILLNKDTPDWPAPFPALLYCFSTIDLLGTVYAGDASKNAETTKHSKDYMTDIMKYPEETACLMQEVFRHKLVHLAQPNPVSICSGKTVKKVNICTKKSCKDQRYGWKYDHDNRSVHLSIEETEKKEKFFIISIWSLAEDIVESVEGYLHRLEKETDLQTNFKKAYEQIDPFGIFFD